MVSSSSDIGHGSNGSGSIRTSKISSSNRNNGRHLNQSMKGKKKRKTVSRKNAKNQSLNPGSTISTFNPRIIRTPTLEDLSKMTLAQAIFEATSSSQLLHTANRMWLPSDDNLAPHLRTQEVHHEKRIKAASQLLKRLGDFIGKEKGVVFDAQLWEEAERNGLKRSIVASSIPFHGDVLSPSYSEKEGRNICIALSGIHAIVGFTLPNLSSEFLNIDAGILEEISSLIRRADLNAANLFMYEAVEVRWAIRGIMARIGTPLLDLVVDRQDISADDEDLPCLLKKAIPNLEARVSQLPFDILPSCLNWEKMKGDESTVKSLLSAIPFSFDTITTRTGSKVEERRGTAWVAEEGIGSLAYSGKLMAPHSLPPIVANAMRQVERGILDHDGHEQLEIYCEEIGKYFDCALCNHYPNEESACKFHTDPEHGTYWERLTCVVSAGDADVRKFAFRPIPDLNDWDKYDPEMRKKNKIGSQKDREKGNGNGIIPGVILLFPGDVVKMDSECNDLFHHAVYNDQVSEVESQSLKKSDGRVSLVFKKAIDRGRGKRGHGKAGKGRRARKIKY